MTTTGPLPGLPMVPGIYRAPNGYLKTVAARGGAARPETAPSAASRPAAAAGVVPLALAANSMELAARPGTSAAAPRHTLGKKVPPYIKEEGQVLRFRAYFQEPVFEGGSVDAAGFRVRSFAIVYYLSDGTLAIEEPRIANSGLTQGKFMKRTRVERPRAVGGGAYAPADFAVGQDIWVYGRRFRIVDADARTREWYRATLGLEQAPEEAVPDDGYARTRARFEKPRPSDNPDKALGGRREKGEYFKKDRKVLRFFARYEDQRLQGDKRDYVMYYYLLNDTIEIKEVAAEGRHNFPNLLRRQKLPKDSLAVPTSYGGTISPRDGQREPIRATSWADLRCGEPINVYGRHLLLTACDASTAAWYAARGVHQRTVTIGHDEAEGRREAAAAPPSNGYGNDDDLYAMGLTLEPANTTVNLDSHERFLKGDKKVCRFQAKLTNVDPDSTDASREFVVNFFLADDTLSVFEPPVRNSGVVGGLFLARGRYKKYIPAVGQEAEGTRLSEKLTMDGGLMEARIGLGGQLSRWLRPTDFMPGNVVTFEMPQSGSKLFTLAMVGHDEYTRKLLEDRTIFPHTKAQLAAARLAEALSSAKLAVRAALRKAASDGASDTLSVDDFARVVGELETAAAAVMPPGSPCHVRLSRSEIEGIAASFSDASGGVVYDDIVDALVLASPRCAKLKDRTSGLRVKERMLRQLHLAYSEGAPGKGALRSVFRAKDPAHTSTVSPADWVQVLRETGLNTIMTRQVAEALCLEHDTHGDGTLDYNALCNNIFRVDCDGPPIAESPAAAAAAAQERRVSAGESAPLTLRDCMRRVNDRVSTADGDATRRLARAMRAFSSAYARAARKKMIRKHFLAFDVGNTGRVTRSQFVETADEVAAEFFMDFDKRDRDLLADYFFPRASCRVDYEELLDVINARDVRRAAALVAKTVAEGNEYEEVFGVNEGAARKRDFGGTLNLFATDK